MKKFKCTSQGNGLLGRFEINNGIILAGNEQDEEEIKSLGAFKRGEIFEYTEETHELNNPFVGLFTPAELKKINLIPAEIIKDTLKANILEIAGEYAGDAAAEGPAELTADEEMKKVAADIGFTLPAYEDAKLPWIKERLDDFGVTYKRNDSKESLYNQLKQASGQ